MPVADFAMFEELVSYVGFTEGDARLLAEARPLVEPAFDSTVEHFYKAITAHPEALEVFENEAQIQRQKAFLRAWMEELFSGRYDERYFEQRARIGRVHVRIGLAQHYMFGAMSVVRTDLTAALRAHLPEGGASRGTTAATERALHRLIDVELAIMLETYREDFVDRLIRTERLATVGQLAATIGHELRNPLAVMETSLHLASRRVAAEDRASKHLDRIRKQIDVCGQIIGDLLSLTRDRPLALKRMPLRSVIEEAVDGLPSKYEVEVRVLADAETPELDIDPGQMRQLVLNLLTNAAAATHGHGRQITVSTAPAGRIVRMRVDDEGPGIPEEIKTRLFEPLVTARAQGIGLGLALCQRIAEKHGGRIMGENRSAGGARFTVELPVPREAG